MSNIARPIAENLFTETPSLIGAQCTACGEVYFPLRLACANCSSTSLETIDLGSVGKLWSWTIQHFMPKSPYNSGETKDTFQPYAIGLIEMPCGIKVKSRLDVENFDGLKIDSRFDLVLMPFREEDTGETIVTFAFKEGTN